MCHPLVVTLSRVGPVTVDEDHSAGADVQALRCRVGARLASCRREAGLSQPQLGHALGRTRSLISKVEHGSRAMPAELWVIADQMCDAQGALVAEFTALAAAEADYRERCRTQRRHKQIHHAGSRTQAAAPRTWPALLVPPAGLGVGGIDAWPDRALVSAGLAEELMAVVTKLVRALGRRDAIRLAGSVLAAAGLPGLDTDEHLRLAHAVVSPRRVDAQVITNLAVVLAHCKRLEDKLGPLEVLDTVVAQHRLVRHLSEGDCPDQLRRPLSIVDSNMASTIGCYLLDMGHPDTANRYFQQARQAGHDARNPAFAAYAAAQRTMVALECSDTPTALDTAAAARSLAARTDDRRLQALAEQGAAAAYALDRQHRPCMIACDRAHQLLTNANGQTPDSPAYWVHHGTIESQRSLFLSLLGRPQEAVEAASSARDRFDRTYLGEYTRCQLRLGHALVLSRDITEATRVLSDAAGHAHLAPRLTQVLHTTRALIQPWATTHAVRTLDDQLAACGLLPPTYPAGQVT